MSPVWGHRPGLNLTMENHFWETGSTDSVDVDSQTFDFIMTGIVSRENCIIVLILLFSLPPVSERQ